MFGPEPEKHLWNVLFCTKGHPPSISTTLVISRQRRKFCSNLTTNVCRTFCVENKLHSQMIEYPVDVSFPVDRQVQESVDACFPYLRHGLRRPSVGPRACKFPKKVFRHGPGGGHSGIPQGRRTQELLRRWSFIFGHYHYTWLSLVLDRSGH